MDTLAYRRIKHQQGVSTINVPPEVSRGTFKFKRKGTGEYIVPSSKPINFSTIDKSILEEVWSRLLKTDFDFDSIVLICPLDLIFEIKRTFYALKFWEYTPGFKRYTAEEILRCSLLDGPTYSGRLQDEWDYGIRRNFRVPGISTEYMDWDPITNYNELPPIAYLIRWEESCSDIDYMKIPLWDFDKDLIEELYDEILDNLPDDLELPQDIEILAEVKTSTTFDLEKMKSIPFYQGRLLPEGHEFSHIFKAKRSIIPVGPANSRDAVVTTIDTYNSIKWCDLVIGTLLDDQEESLISNNSQTFIRRLKNMTEIPRRGQMYWLRDIKKCGLTFPRELIHLVQKALVEKYPTKDFSRFDIYRQFSIWDEDNKPIETVRGYCLGMANNLVTFIQCMISRMLIKRIAPNIEVEALYGNDDSCLKIWTKEGLLDNVDAMMIQTADFDLLRGLNIVTNDNKSFWSWYPVLFEEYGHQDFKIKHSRIACALSSGMLAPDIKYAKFLTSSISLALWDNGDWIESPLNELIAKWGFEYYPQEASYDYLLGGWISIRNKGMNPMLRMIENCPDELLQPMWVAANQQNKFQKEVITPVLKGTVTKNYSVTGSILNITYVDTEIYDVPELPVETLYLNRESYKKFYESIYKFNRNPYSEMARRLHRVTSFSPGKIVDRRSFMEFCLGNFSKLAIPKSLVILDSNIFEIQKDTNLDCSSMMRNCLSRYIMELKKNNLLMCPDLEVPASGEYPFVVTYDSTPYTERIYSVTSLDGDIPEGIYQYSTNPWLPLYEYVMEYDQYPTVLERIVEDRKHLPIWFMNRPYKSSTEVALAYNFIDEGELYVSELIDIYREAKKEEVPDVKEKLFTPRSCGLCIQSFSGWDAVDDIFSIHDDTCTLCIAQDQLWRARKLSTLATSERARLDYLREVPIIRSRIRYLINTYFPILTSSESTFLQTIADSEDIFYAPIGGEEEALFDMFGD
jgi:hypothetical protein